jgi:DNA polymerase III subunit delta'
MTLTQKATVAAAITDLAPPGLLPWLEAPLHEALRTRHAHALLVHGPEGVGQFDLALALAQAWLCESADATAPTPRACGLCVGCRLMRARSHPDVMVLVPEALRETCGWATDDASEEGGSSSSGEAAGKRKPSKDIRVEEVRRVVAFAHNTAARGRGKVVLIFPAERLNLIAANALLKTLEEPPGKLRFVLAGAAADGLLPTLRSRCQSLFLALPDTDVAATWLSAQGVAHADVMLAAAGGQPESALRWHREGLDARTWLALPEQLARGDAASVSAWPLGRVIDMLFKVCHDAMRAAAGAAPRYFPTQAIDRRASISALSIWHRELARVALHAEHPWAPAIAIEVLVAQARAALSGSKSTDWANGPSIH